MANMYLEPFGFKDGFRALRATYYGYSYEVANNDDGTYNVTTVTNAPEDAIFLAKDNGMVLMRGETPTKWYKQ